MPRFSSFCLIVLLLTAGSWVAPAGAEVRRCVHPDGDVAYTDRNCTSIGAVERAPLRALDGGSRLYRSTCPRNTQDLMFEMSRAIADGDVNHLASLYHWAGVSSRAADGVMRQLETLVQRPLIAVAPVMATPAAGALAAPAAVPVAYRDATPVAVRIEQTLADSPTPSSTVFRLHHYFGCLWIRDGSPS